jgi:cytochrome c biogenesis protein CcdA
MNENLNNEIIAEEQTKHNEEKRLYRNTFAIKVVAIMFFVVIFIIAVVGFTADYKALREDETTITSIDGIAYIKSGDMIVKLMDKDGKQVVYNDMVNSNHNLSKSIYTSNIGGRKVRIYFIEDTDTETYYIGILDLSTNTSIEALNLMYKK